MKLKQIPNDFRVEELTSVVPTEGPYAFYRLEKINWTTPDALNLIRRRWNIPFNRLAYGGLKDRHARTVQFLTIFHGAQRNFTHPGVDLTYLGQRDQAFASTDIDANRFILTLRSMSSKAILAAQQAKGELEKVGVPNYFDDQRFGSVGFDGRFVAKEMVLGRYEQALKTALSAPYEHDRGSMKREKALLREAWGDWPRLKAELPKGHARSIVDYMVHHPADFKGALERLKPELKSLYLSAWQSHLWNKLLAGWIMQNVPNGQLLGMRSKLGELPVPRMLKPERLELWKSLELPLPSARLKVDPDASYTAILDQVMEEEGVPLSEMKLKAFRKPFFSKGDRVAAVIPSGLSMEVDEDELNRGKQKLVLKFDLPRGCYATMIVKRLTQMRD
jgi:tRNA pseudouridine13 synthase